MKKITLLLLCLLLLSGGSAAQNYCPSRITFNGVHTTGRANHFRVNLLLNNSSQYLNAFSIILLKPNDANWAIVDEIHNKPFTAQGYGKYILARWEGKTDEEREEGLSAHCDIQSNVGSNGLLTVIEILITDECRFFPVRNDSGGYDWYFIPVGEFAVDLSNCADGEYEISSYLSGCYFGYIGVEGATGMNQDFEPKLTLYKRGDYVSTDWRIPLDDFDGVEEIEEANSVGSVRYYNLAGVESAEPQPGVNLKVTTWSDGSRTTEKIIK